MTTNIKWAPSTANNVLQSLVSWISYSHSACFPLSSNLVIPSLILSVLTQRTIFILAKAHNELATCFSKNTKAIRRDFYFSHYHVYQPTFKWSCTPYSLPLDELSVLLRTTLLCAHSTASNLPAYSVNEITPSSLLYYIMFRFYYFISISLYTDYAISHRKQKNIKFILILSLLVPLYFS